MPTIVIRAQYEPDLECYAGASVDGKPVQTPLEAVKFDLEQLDDGAMSLDEFIAGMDVTIEVEP
jgi:hypothetical protein